MGYTGTITYKDLITNLVNAISGYCQNINKDAILPDAMNPEKEPRILKQFSRKKTNDCWAKGKPVDKLDGGLSLIMLAKSVTSDTVKTQLNKFFDDRGISNKDDEVITFKGLMNFYVNAASFITSRILLIGNSFYADAKYSGSVFGEKEMIDSSWAIPLYDSSDDVVYQNYVEKKWDRDENFDPVTPKYTNQNIKDDVSLLVNSMINRIGIKFVKTNITFGCCSSSSSSCCSSCSSSSSMFIAYMEI